MRPVQVIDKPNMEPFVCIKCGSGPTVREHFVDLGVDSALDRIDEYGAKHLTDGVIYLCNECMTGLIIDYLRKVFKFINAQKTGHELHAMQNSQTTIIQQQEIEHLRKQVIKLEEKLATAKQEAVFNPVVEEVAEVSARDQLKEIFPDDEESELEDGSDGSVISTEGSDDSASAGAVENSDGNSAATESFVASDLFDLKAGNLVTGKGD